MVESQPAPTLEFLAKATSIGTLLNLEGHRQEGNNGI